MLRVENDEDVESARADVITVMLQAKDAIKNLQRERAGFWKETSDAMWRGYGQRIPSRWVGF